MTLLGKQINFTTDLFEIVVTLGCTISAAIFGALNLPESVPVSLSQFTILSSILGFTVGYGTSSFLVARYKEIKKKRVK